MIIAAVARTFSVVQRELEVLTGGSVLLLFPPHCLRAEDGKLDQASWEEKLPSQHGNQNECPSVLRCSMLPCGGTYLLPFAEPIYQHVSEKEEQEGQSTTQG